MKGNEQPKLYELVTHVDDRGSLYEIQRNSWRKGKPIRQVYCSTIRPNVIKAFHMHKKQTDYVCCVKGEVMVRLVPFSAYPFLNDKKNLNGGKGLYEFYKRIMATMQTFYLGDKNRKALKIPKGWWHGWKNIGEEEALVINTPDKEYDGKDEYRANYGLLGVNWDVKMG